MNVICSICTESLRPNVDFSANSCGHSFHSQCIQQWIQRNPTCPQCRKVCTKKHLCRLFLTMTEQQRAMQQDDVMRQKEKELKDQKTQWAVLNQKYQNKVKAHEQTIHEVQILRSDKQKSSKIISNLENRLTEVNSIIANNCQMKEEVRTLRTSKENSEKTMIYLTNELISFKEVYFQMEKELIFLKKEKEKFSNTTFIESLRLNFKEKLSEEDYEDFSRFINTILQREQQAVTEKNIAVERGHVFYEALGELSKKNIVLQENQHQILKSLESTIIVNHHLVWFLLAAGSAVFLYRRIRS